MVDLVQGGNNPFEGYNLKPVSLDVGTPISRAGDSKELEGQPTKPQANESRMKKGFKGLAKGVLVPVAFALGTALGPIAGAFSGGREAVKSGESEGGVVAGAALLGGLIGLFTGGVTSSSWVCN